MTPVTVTVRGLVRLGSNYYHCYECFNTITKYLQNFKKIN